MKKAARRIMAVFLCVISVILPFAADIAAGAENDELYVNKRMLENMLENRSWVVESLVDGNFENNPYAQLLSYSSASMFFDEVLENYYKDDAFRMLVTCLEESSAVTANASDFITKFGAVLLNLLGQVTDEEMIDFVDEFAKSADDLQYESIINAVLTENYTNSAGVSLMQTDSDIEHLRALGENIKHIDTYRTLLKSVLKNDNVYKDESELMEFTDSVLPGIQSLTTYTVKHTIEMCGGDPEVYNSERQKQIDAIIGKSASVILAVQAMYDPAKGTEIPESVDEIVDSFRKSFLGDFSSFLDGVGVAFDLSNAAIEYATILNSLSSQKNTTVGALNRMSAYSDREELSTTVGNYNKMLSEQFDIESFDYKAIIYKLNSSNYIEGKLIKKATDGFKNIVKELDGTTGGFKLTSAGSMAGKLASLGKVVSIAVFVADKATNIKETAKKIYVCKYIQYMIDAAVKAYKADLSAYKKSKTDENAKKVLDDLELLRKLRLYGEKQAYGSVVSQTTSVIGTLLSGGYDDTADITRRYKAHIDTIMACTPIVSFASSFCVNKGQTLTVLPMAMDNGKICLYAKLTESSGKIISEFPEADVLFGAQFILNGGTLAVLRTDKSKMNGINLSCVEVKSDSTVKLNRVGIYMNRLVNSAKLNIEALSDNTHVEITDSFENTGTVTFLGSETQIVTNTLNNSGTIGVGASELICYSSLNNGGTINGKIRLCDKGKAPTYYSVIGYSDDDNYTLSGSGTVDNLIFDNSDKRGVKISGSQSVSGSFSNSSTRLRTPENLYLTGSCTVDGAYMRSGISLKNFTSSQSITFKEAVSIAGDVTLNSKCVFGDVLYMTANAGTLTLASPADIIGDFVCNGGTVAGSDYLTLYGSADINTSTAQITKLKFNGSVPQSLYSSGALTVTDFVNNNTSKDGISVNSTVYVTGTLSCAKDSRFANGKNLYLTGNAKIGSSGAHGSLSVKDWTCSDDMTVYGSLFASGSVTVAQNKTLSSYGYTQSDGRLNVSDGAVLNVDGDMNAKETENAGVIKIKGDSVFSGKLNGGTVISDGDMDMSADFTPDSLKFTGKTAQYVYNTASTNVKNLEIDNMSKSGFNVKSVINVSDKFTNKTKNLINSSNIKLKGGSIYDDCGTSSRSDLTVSGDYTLQSGKTLTVNGDFKLTSGAKLTVEDGAKLKVNGNFVSDSADIIVIKDGSITVNDYFSVKSGSLALGGSAEIKGDTVLANTVISGDGGLIMKGDIENSSCTWNSPALEFNSRLPQYVGGDNITAGSLTVKNGSKSGITFGTSVYYDELTSDSVKINNENKLIKK